MIHKFDTFNENIFKPKKIEDRAEILKKKELEFLEEYKSKVVSYHIPDYSTGDYDEDPVKVKKYIMKLAKKCNVKIEDYVPENDNLNIEYYVVGVHDDIKKFFMALFNIKNDEDLKKECKSMGYTSWIDSFKESIS